MLLLTKKVFDKNEVFISRNDLSYMRKQKELKKIEKQIMLLSV